MTSKALISETEHVIAIEQDLGGDSVVVTFNSLGQFRNGLHFWGDSNFLKQGISAVGIVSVGPNWYPRRAMDEILRAVGERIKGRNIVTYGYGQGGYGALKFAARLRASATLSFSPQWSINPADVAPFDRRFMRYFDETLGNGLRIEQGDLCSHSFVFYDRMEKSDARNATKLAALTGVKTVVTPFDMSETIRIVTKGRGAVRLIHLCMSATPPDPLDLRSAIRASRGQSTTYLDSTLRRLILRMSKSRGRSSVFVSNLLRNVKDHSPFYSALIAHADGNERLAQSELSKATVDAFKNVDLLPWWHVLHKIQFVGAELAVATQIFLRHGNNTAACLLAIKTLMKTGDLEGAYRELSRLTKHSDAVYRIASFVEFSVKLRRTEIIEAFLSDRLSYSATVLVLFSLADIYEQLGNRKAAFAKLMDLATTCANSPTDLRRVASYGLQLHEIAFALELLERLSRDDPRDYLLALDVVDARIPSNKHLALSDLEKIMSAPDLSSAAWQRASILYERLGNAKAAFRTIEAAVSLPDSSPEARHRLVVLLRRKGKTSRARRELATLLAEGRADPRQLRASGDLALSLNDRQLAQKFAEAQFERAPTNSECILYLARCSRVVGNRVRAERLLFSLFEAERRSPSMPDRQWVKLAQELYEVGNIALAKEAIVEAVTREPTSEVARKLSATIALLEKLAKR